MMCLYFKACNEIGKLSRPIIVYYTRSVIKLRNSVSSKYKFTPYMIVSYIELLKLLIKMYHFFYPLCTTLSLLYALLLLNVGICLTLIKITYLLVI